MRRQSQTVTELSACIKVSKSSPSELISLLPAMPFASTVTMSLVEVSPSMLIMLKVSATSPDSAFCSISLLTEQSVVMNTSRALGDAAYLAFNAAYLEADGDLLDLGVGRHDALGCVERAVAQCGVELRDSRGYRHNVERLTDNAR